MLVFAGLQDCYYNQSFFEIDYKRAIEFLVTSLYEGSKTKVKVGSEFSEEFFVLVGVHQGSVF